MKFADMDDEQTTELMNVLSDEIAEALPEDALFILTIVEHGGDKVAFGSNVNRVDAMNVMSDVCKRILNEIAESN